MLLFSKMHADVVKNSLKQQVNIKKTLTHTPRCGAGPFSFSAFNDGPTTDDITTSAQKTNIPAVLKIIANSLSKVWTSGVWTGCCSKKANEG